MLFVGAVALVARCPYLFPSLGPTAFLQAEYPHHRTAGIYHVIVGHLLGLVSGFLAVGLLAMGTPPATSGAPLSLARLGAVALAVATTMLLQLVLRASHPPAVSTTLLIALGAFDVSMHTVATVVTGVILVAVPGDLLRRVRLGRSSGRFRRRRSANRRLNRLAENHGAARRGDGEGAAPRPTT